MKFTVEENANPASEHPTNACYDPRHFSPFSEREREEKLRAFAEFLKERDGVPDLASRTLSRREER